jgi:hypothetical protein
MAITGEIARATGLCVICDFKFHDEVVARYPEPNMPGGWAYIELRHLDPQQLALTSEQGFVSVTSDNGRLMSKHDHLRYSRPEHLGVTVGLQSTMIGVAVDGQGPDEPLVGASSDPDPVRASLASQGLAPTLG